MRVTRRGAIAGGVTGALAVPTLAGLANWRWARGDASLLLFDPSLAAGRRFAEAGRAAGGRVHALAGDPVRLAREAVRGAPALLAGVSRHAEALLFEEVAAEAGYALAAALAGPPAACTTADCRPGWQALSRLATGAGATWIEALANFAARPGAAMPALPPMREQAAGAEVALAWVLTRR